MESLSLVFWIVFNELVMPEAKSSFIKLLLVPTMANFYKHYAMTTKMVLRG